MITREEREKDKAALAALPSYIEIDEDGSIWDCPGQGAHVARVGDASDADIRPALAHAVNRLPVYMEDAEEMERRIEALSEAARRHEAGEIRLDADGKLPPTVSRALDDTAAAILRLAVKLLRGGQ